MNLPPNVTEAQWQRALANYGHPWKPGRRCDWADDLRGSIDDRLCIEHEAIGMHDIPMPAVTDELLWQMLVNLVEQCDTSVELFSDGCIELDGVGGFRGPLAAAVILAWASMGVK